jgi:hypothetical protein
VFETKQWASSWGLEKRSGAGGEFDWMLLNAVSGMTREVTTDFIHSVLGVHFVWVFILMASVIM